MITLHEWALKYNIPHVALHELQVILGMHGGHVLGKLKQGASEAAVQSLVRIEASQKGVYLFRNNVGVLRNEDGRPVRYGLANDSKQVNETIKSGDLIGFRPVKIEPHHVGYVIGQFVSRECKEVDWQWSGTEHEQAQLAWAQLVIANGGDAAFATGEGTL